MAEDDKSSGANNKAPSVVVPPATDGSIAANQVCSSAQHVTSLQLTPRSELC
jgi:hypothetical protein